MDEACTLSQKIPFPQNNVIMAGDYVASLFRSFGYDVSLEPIVLDKKRGLKGNNIVATKIVSQFPDTFIEVGGHLDSVSNSPGAGDNAAGIAAVVEMSRVVARVHNRYSWRFIGFVGEEHGEASGVWDIGSKGHVKNVISRGEHVRAAIIIDGIGWSEAYPGQMVFVGHNPDSDRKWPSLRLADSICRVQRELNIGIGCRIGPDDGTGSDHISYWDFQVPAVITIGGWPFNAPYYHGAGTGCQDVVRHVDFENVYKTTQLDIGALLMIDADAPEVFF